MKVKLIFFVILLSIISNSCFMNPIIPALSSGRDADLEFEPEFYGDTPEWQQWREVYVSEEDQRIREVGIHLEEEGWVDRRLQVLVFSKTAGYRHGAIEAAKRALDPKNFPNSIFSDEYWNLIFSEDSSIFNKDLSSRFDAVIFLLTTGDVLNDLEQEYFKKYINNGGGYLGIHSAADTEYDWDWYGGLVGAYFAGHEEVKEGTISVLDRSHPSTEHLQQRWKMVDEWYDYDRNPRGEVHVLAVVDQGKMGPDHPITWCHNYDGGRSFYTGMGHTEEIYSDRDFQRLLAGAARWVTGFKDGDCEGGLWKNYRRDILAEGIEGATEIDVSDNKDVYFVERFGKVKMICTNSICNPGSRIGDRSVMEIGEIDVFTGIDNGLEYGLLGMALDPNFKGREGTGHIYLYYSHPTESHQTLSRFDIVDYKLDMDSEISILKVESQRETCCHAGGSIEFDSNGNLYLSTGDDTNPFASDGFSPIDETDGRKPWDAARSSGNTNDLRGKILRIKPLEDGSYEIPAGNLFLPGVGRPEIYVMGNRNPYRISIDQKNNWLYWGEIGPDASEDNDNRGPMGYDEINQAKMAGNYGWPFCIANNQPYREYDFKNKISSDYFDCENLKNNSINNTGSIDIPAANEAFIWYPYSQSEEFPLFSGGGRSAMAGPVFNYPRTEIHDLDTGEIRFEPWDEPRGFPLYYDNVLFIYEWSRFWIRTVFLTEGKYEILHISEFLPDEEFLRPVDMVFDDQDSLYVLEYGQSWYGYENSRVSRITYTQTYFHPPRKEGFEYGKYEKKTYGTKWRHNRIFQTYESVVPGLEHRN